MRTIILMTQRFAKIDGEWRWFDTDVQPSISESIAPYIHDDTFKKALVHPKTGERVDSMTRWNRINKENGLKVVGNDWIGKKSPRGPEKLTEAQIMDKVEKAEAILSDPSRRNSYYNEQMERSERNQRLLGNR